MTTTETNIGQVARWFHALSDETRLRVVELLAGGERCVCELQEAVAAAQSRLSFHLRVLREAGLVVDRRQGRWNYYSLRPEVLEEMAAYLRERKPADGACAACGRGAGAQGECCD
ncbi:MAG: winged helix-turn-helix transcriptional regulator [Gemmatimonadetes bacterium]|nr:winged helix-turn-helix transcriptional regulator [Gemmatimonadota bacterium]